MFFAVLCPALPARGTADDEQSLELFERKVRPLLVEHCQQCHGPKKQWAGLRMDSREGLLKGGESGPAIVPGDPDASELFSRVTDPDPEVRMPPADSSPPLSGDELASLKRWIALGALWPTSPTQSVDAQKLAQQRHWAFQPVTKPAVPAVRSQTVGDNPVDRFIVEKLKDQGLELSPEADPRTLLRRASYDLIGMPPTAEDVAAVAQDARGYEHAIDRLLESPHYGEQWGRHWLDVARYSDTKGYVYTREERFFVHAAAYRDWVIRAFNDDMPYDRFVLLQIAADQVAPGDPAALAATGFLTLGRRFLGVTADIIDDRIDVVGRGLLGLTVSCARCHDHKYDPIPTADYYSLYGVFQNCRERQLAIPRPPDAAPPTPEFEAGLAERQKKADALTAASRAEAASRIRERLGEYLLAQRHLDDHPVFANTQITTKDDLLAGIVRSFESFLARAKRNCDPVFVPWIALAALGDQEFPEAAVHLCREWQQPGAHVNGRVARAFAVPPTSPKDAADRYAALVREIDAEWIAACNEAKLGGRPEPTSLQDSDSEAFRQAIYGSDSPCVIPDEPIVNTEPYWDTATVESLWKHQAEVDRWLLKHPECATMAMPLFDCNHLEEQAIFRRGNSAMKGDVVPRQFLRVVSGSSRQPFTNGSGRLEMAQAIVDPTNPLTVRVWVNRVWMHHFGQGLVTSPSDFGVRSSPPSHPELLDWLAQEFVAHGWSTKWLHRTIMLSATYRQSCAGPNSEAVRQLAISRDPENRLLWRMNVRRLSMEAMRDTMIAVAGELDATQRGPVDPFKSGADGFRRSVYMLIDRQFLPTAFNVFDFANPDLHTPQRSETTVPQQALFAMNSPFVADRARSIAKQTAGEVSPERRIRLLFQRVLQRQPTADDMHTGLAFVAAATESHSPLSGAVLEASQAAAASGLTPWEQFAQVLLMSNEFMFMD